MRISDWSSDVCSSDLEAAAARIPEFEVTDFKQFMTYSMTINSKNRSNTAFVSHSRQIFIIVDVSLSISFCPLLYFASSLQTDLGYEQIARASCRERVCQYV